MRTATRYRFVAAIALIAAAGVLVEAASADVRAWLADRALTSGILVGALLIAATYLVVERVLAERERERWAEAAGPLLNAIAVAGAAADVEARSAMQSRLAPALTPQTEWLDELLQRYQPALSGTPELVARWHAALSLVQHAKAVEASPPAADEAYEAAWRRFCATFADVKEFTRSVPEPGTTWAVMPAVGDGRSRDAGSG
jgi:hypothetical protein